MRVRLTATAVSALAILLTSCPANQPCREEILSRDATIRDLQAQLQQKQNEGDKSNQAKVALAETLHGLEAELESMGAQRPHVSELSADIETGLSAPQSQREKLAEMFVELRTQQQAMESRATDATAHLQRVQELFSELGAPEQADFQTRIEAAHSRLQAILGENEQLHTTIEQYQTNLVEARAQIDTLNLQTAAQTEEIKKREDAIGAMKAAELVGHVFVGPASDLVHKRLLRGWLGGSKFPDCAACGCSQLDLATTLTILIPAPHVTVFTIHPVDSYELKQADGQTTLKVVRPETFWRYSRCLIVSY